MNSKRIIPVALAFAAAAFITTTFAQGQTRPDPDPGAPKMLQRPGQARLAEPDLKPGAQITAFELAWTPPEPKEAINRVQGAIKVMAGKDRATRGSERDALDRMVHGEDAGSWTRLGHSPIMVRYQPEYDEIRLFNEELAAIDFTEQDIGEKEASARAEQYLTALGKAGVINPRLYADAAMQLGYKKVVEGSVDKKPKAGRIVEYRVTYRPRLNGFELANAGVRLGIAPSGELVTLRVGGVTPSGEWQGDELASSLRDARKEIRVGTDELMSRFYKQVGKDAEAQVAWSRVMYAMPEGKSEAVVEPMLLVSYSLSREVGDQRVVSRRKTLGYSLTDPRAAPVDFDPPAAQHEAPRTTRQAGQADQSKQVEQAEQDRNP